MLGALVRLWHKPLGRAGILLANLVALFFLFTRWGDDGPFLWSTPIDLDVYRIGAQAWLDGVPLYGELPLTQAGVALPFTYPPLAAVLFVPLTWMSWQTAAMIFTAVTALLTALVAAMVLDRLGVRANGRVPWPLLTALPLALALDPIRGTAGFGQINVILMALVAVDVLARNPRWPRGLLVGIAAAIKLTPAVFLLFFLLNKDRRAALTTLIGFAGATVLGFLLSWGDSVQYWLHTLADTSRIGGATYPGNQAVKAVVARFGLEGAPLTILWLLGSLGVLFLVWRGMRQALDHVGLPWALCLNAVAGLLVSPVSWSHHWVWVVPTLICLVVLGVRTRDRLALWLAGALAVVTFLSPHWWISYYSDKGWNVFEHLLGNAYTIVAVAILWCAPRLFVARDTAPAEIPEQLPRTESRSPAAGQ